MFYFKTPPVIDRLRIFMQIHISMKKRMRLKQKFILYKFVYFCALSALSDFS